MDDKGGRAPIAADPSGADSTDVHPEPPSPGDPRLTTWRAFLYAQSTVMPRLDAELRSSSQLTLAEFDALAQLAFAQDRRLRMSDLADRVLLSRSGVTRLVDRLERGGDVRRRRLRDGRLRRELGRLQQRRFGRLRVGYT